MITIDHVQKGFNGNPVLRDVNMTIRTGETVVIIGRSGCGKSVLLKNIIGLLKPDAGNIYIDDIDITRLSHRELFELRRKFGMLFQNSALFDSMTVEENIALGLVENRIMSKQEASSRVRQCLEMVGLEGIEEMKPADLSGGMKKRVALARAIAVNPEIIFYDEPTTGLDPIMADVINELICELKSKLAVTSIVVTHDMTSAYKVGDRIIMLHRGVNLFEGTPDQVKKTTHEVVRQFIEGRAEGPIEAKKV
jgi:phospholipid/cholesterol/gamma-HCH transport system ATP-binding protein